MSDLKKAGAVVYGIGSIYTSIAPSLILRGVGEAIAARDVPKVLMANGSHDRETSARLGGEGPMTVVRFVAVAAGITDCFNPKSVS
jgi:2-phospho-L-lactate transferase/gluconeogenesis factor (CofD/UPF0052 family)